MTDQKTAADQAREKAARFQRLPRWAQDELTRLRRERDEAQRELHGHLERGEFTPTSYGTRVPSKVRLITPCGLSVVAHDDHHIEIMADGGLVARPQAGNVVLVRPTRGGLW